MNAENFLFNGKAWHYWWDLYCPECVTFASSTLSWVNDWVLIKTFWYIYDVKSIPNQGSHRVSHTVMCRWSDVLFQTFLPPFLSLVLFFSSMPSCIFFFHVRGLLMFSAICLFITFSYWFSGPFLLSPLSCWLADISVKPLLSGFLSAKPTIFMYSGHDTLPLGPTNQQAVPFESMCWSLAVESVYQP